MASSKEYKCKDQVASMEGKGKSKVGGECGEGTNQFDINQEIEAIKNAWKGEIASDEIGPSSRGVVHGLGDCDGESQIKHDKEGDGNNDGAGGDGGIGHFDDSDYDFEEVDSSDEEILKNNVDMDENRDVAGPSVGVDGSDGREDILGLLSDEDICIGVGSDWENEEESFPIYNPSSKYNPTFALGQTFSSKEEVKEAIQGYSVKQRKNIKFLKNDKIRLYVRCAENTCPWMMNVLKEKNESTFRIRMYNPKHTCIDTDVIKRLSAPWLARRFQEWIRSNTKVETKGFRLHVAAKTKCDVSRQKAYRAKRMALSAIQGDYQAQYASLWDYAVALRRKTPDSTVIMQLEDGVDGNEQERFNKFYVCFKALVNGFLSGCRPIIGVDGCHLKCPEKGVLLMAVAIDPNNELYPIAYAVVGSETSEAWEWFLNLLREDLDVVRDGRYTFISNKQTELIAAFQNVFPGSTNRFCVRHLHANMKLAGFKGLPHKSALWKAAKASNTTDFEMAMQEVGELDPKCLEWVRDKLPSQWSRAYFSEAPKCHILLNNLCESFNRCILDAGEKSIVSILEWIGVYLMNRLTHKRDRSMRRWNDMRLCPKIKKIVDKNIVKAGDCIPLKSNDWHYEILCSDRRQYYVDLEKRSCSCRIWQLTGIPCCHGMSAICAQRYDPEDFVEHWYTVETFNQVYQHAILPVDRPELLVPPLPPNKGRKRGKPVKARKMKLDEVISKRRKTRKGSLINEIQMRKQSWRATCKFCGGKGHNVRGCSRKKFGLNVPIEDEGVVQLPDEMTQAEDIPQMT